MLVFLSGKTDDSKDDSLEPGDGEEKEKEETDLGKSEKTSEPFRTREELFEKLKSLKVSNDERDEDEDDDFSDFDEDEDEGDLDSD